MRRLAYGLVIALCLAAFAVPAMAAENTSEYRHGYITVQSVEIDLVNDEATVNVTYTVDDGVQLLVHFLGMSDLRTKVTEVANFQNATIEEIGMDHAVLVVEGAANGYDDGTFRFYEHEFSVSVPEITVKTPQEQRVYYNTTRLPASIGYFRT
ncbi:hypothetical protein E2N92_02440 [Methanofollis formosanus]|uniref:Uncharacterized protein n=1 Tax=Methanofollis formosanus TaxID=299308 RepID=A0A8G1A0M7_9EURY|nr:hypothetical protein [Methanofollis formosanus]QYZ78370.1 hypothetical protein E2N92_02440 [Methanofollis formosanus]